MLYKFVVLCPLNEDFIREIEINSNTTLLQLHQIIQKSLNFDASVMTSFFTSNQRWEELEEITLLEMDEDDFESDRKVMDVTCLYEVVKEVKDRLLYYFDLINRRALFIELVEIIPGNFEGVARCFHETGNPPPQLLQPEEFEELLHLEEEEDSKE